MIAAKAVIGALVTGLATAGTALADEVLTAAEGVGIAGSMLAAFAAVYFLPNGGPGSDTPDA